MIAILSGTISEKLKDQVVLDISGVGYGLFVTVEDYGRLSNDAKAKLYVYEHIREQAHDLFGFIDLDTKQLFEQLLDVNGVGPKMALSLLNIGSASDLRQAIATGDTKFITRAGGVGKRVAERLVIELKNKVGLDGLDLNGSGLMQSESLLLKDEAVQGLVALGYTPEDASRALKKVDAALPTTERIRQALKQN